MFKNDLYSIDSLEVSGDDIKAVIAIDPKHIIFTGHFPGQPVLPGVCTIEILKELVNEARGSTYALKEASQMKFLSLVDPVQANVLHFQITLSETDSGLAINAQAALEDGTTTFKLKGILG